MSENITTLLDKASAADIALNNLLYLVQGTGSDRDRKLTLEQLRDFLQGVFTLISFSGTEGATTFKNGSLTFAGNSGTVTITQTGLTIKNAAGTSVASIAFDGTNLRINGGGTTGLVSFAQIFTKVLSVQDDRTGLAYLDNVNAAHIYASDAQKMADPYAVTTAVTSDQYDSALFGEGFAEGQRAGVYVMNAANTGAGETAQYMTLNRAAKGKGEIITIINTGALPLIVSGSSADNITMRSVTIEAETAARLIGWTYTDTSGAEHTAWFKLA